MVNGKIMKVSPLFREVLGDMSKRNNNLSMFSLTHVIAINLKNRETEIVLGKRKKVFIKQNDRQNFIELF